MKIKKLTQRICELITMPDNSKGMNMGQVEAISAEGSEIISQLSPEMVLRIFKNA